MLDRRVYFGGEDVPAFIASVPEMPRPRGKGRHILLQVRIVKS